MNEKPPFINLDLRQPINQWLGIGLISMMCFWVVLYYFTHNAFAVGANIAPHISELQQ
jgi:hypothetical protein